MRWEDPTASGSFLRCCGAQEALEDLSAGSVGMVLTDPPYAVLTQEWDVGLDWPKIWPEVWRVCRPRAAAVFFAASPFTYDLVNSQRDKFRYPMVWLKSTNTNFLQAKKRPLSTFEDILVYASSGPTYYPQKSPGPKYARMLQPRDNSIYGRLAKKILSTGAGRYPVSVLAVSKEEGTIYHPSQKPLELLEYLIRTYTKPGERVVDFTMGSGSTCLAARNVGRCYLGVEHNKEFYEIAKKRMIDNQGMLAAAAPPVDDPADFSPPPPELFGDGDQPTEEKQ